MKSKAGRFQSRSGQAALEYILLLFVIVAIGLGVVYQFNSAFRSFASNYFGNYFACLLETGELPSLGSTDGSGGDCDSAFQPFDIANGRPYRETSTGSIGGGGSNGTSDGTTGNQNQANNNSNNDTTANPNVGKTTPDSGPPPQSGLDESGSSSGSQGSKGDSPRGSIVQGSSLDAAAADSGGFRKGGAGGQKVNLTAAESAALDKRKNEEDSGRLRYVPSQKEKETGEDLRQRTISAGEGNAKDDGKRVPANLDNKKKGQGTDADVGLTLPDLLRYLLIAAILIAILFFFGGQALQFSKSQEK